MTPLLFLFLVLTAGLAGLALLLVLAFWALLQQPTEDPDANLPPITPVR